MERRKEYRYPLECSVEAAPSKQGRVNLQTLRGTVVNVSSGGACVVGGQFVEPLSIFPTRFRFPGVPVPVPVLTQVRWIEPAGFEESTFRIGLVFLA
jgi:hypothetical protein